MIKSSTLFHCGPLPPSYSPDIIHLISIPKPSIFLATLSGIIVYKKYDMGEACERGYSAPTKQSNATCMTRFVNSVFGSGATILFVRVFFQSTMIINQMFVL